jgi:hypothetical protein
MAVPLLLAATYLCRAVAARALAAAALPVVALALWLTASGLSVPVAALGLLVFFLLAGHGIAYLPEALVYHYGPTDMAWLRQRRVRMMRAGCAYMFMLLIEEPG